MPQGKYLVLFFYPLNFTFVCPTEIIAFSDRVEEFRAIDAEVGVRGDPMRVFSAGQWSYTRRGSQGRP